MTQQRLNLIHEAGNGSAEALDKLDTEMPMALSQFGRNIQLSAPCPIVLRNQEDEQGELMSDVEPNE